MTGDEPRAPLRIWRVYDLDGVALFDITGTLSEDPTVPEPYTVVEVGGQP